MQPQAPDFTVTKRSFDYIATRVIDVLDFLTFSLHGCFYNQVLADVRSTGAGVKCPYCKFHNTCSYVLLPFVLLHNIYHNLHIFSPKTFKCSNHEFRSIHLIINCFNTYGTFFPILYFLATLGLVRTFQYTDYESPTNNYACQLMTAHVCVLSKLERHLGGKHIIKEPVFATALCIYTSQVYTYMEMYHFLLKLLRDPFFSSRPSSQPILYITHLLLHQYQRSCKKVSVCSKLGDHVMNKSQLPSSNLQQKSSSCLRLNEEVYAMCMYITIH